MTSEAAPCESVCARCWLGVRGACRLGVLPHLRILRLPPDTTLFYEGDRPCRFGVLRSGYMRLMRFGPDGQRRGLGVARPGDLIGGLPGRRIDHMLETVTEVVLCMTDSRGLEAGLQDDPGLRRQLIRDAAAQLARVQELIWLRGRLGSRERVIAFLLLSTRFMPVDHLPDGSCVITMRLPRRDWADISDTTPETISRTVRALNESGDLESLGRDRYRIRNFAKMCEMARLDPQEVALGASPRRAPARPRTQVTKPAPAGHPVGQWGVVRRQ